MKPIGLDALDARASLQRRVDQKYLVPRDVFESLLTKLDSRYEQLEIDGERAFAYESIYFDTPDLLCFRQHVGNEPSRFKTRSRLYEDTEACVFEVKLKTADGTMDKRHLDRSPEQHGALDDQACTFLDDTIAAGGFARVAEKMERSLTTRFSRRTYAAIEGAERVTCDRQVEMRRADGGVAFLDPDHILVESKSEGGTGDWDEALTSEGIEPISLSKYRVGHSLLGAPDPEEPLSAWARRLFSVNAG